MRISNCTILWPFNNKMAVEIHYIIEIIILFKIIIELSPLIFVPLPYYPSTTYVSTTQNSILSDAPNYLYWQHQI